MTSPAIFADGALMAVPLAHYLNRAEIGSECGVCAQFSAPGGLPLQAPPAYGPAGSLDPPP
jgi:hypothetical protein